MIIDWEFSKPTFSLCVFIFTKISHNYFAHILGHLIYLKNLISEYYLEVSYLQNHTAFNMVTNVFFYSLQQRIMGRFIFKGPKGMTGTWKLGLLKTKKQFQYLQ